MLEEAKKLRKLLLVLFELNVCYEVPLILEVAFLFKNKLKCSGYANNKIILWYPIVPKSKLCKVSQNQFNWSNFKVEPTGKYLPRLFEKGFSLISIVQLYFVDFYHLTFSMISNPCFKRSIIIY